MSHIATISPVSADIIERAMHTDLVKDFTTAADRIWHTPAGPDLAVIAAIETAIDEWAYDNKLTAAMSADQRDHIFHALRARCWSEYEENPPALPFGAAYDALCQRNDHERGMSV